ncbi:hypothetical protein DFH06DRAFT_195385 [Mycena polygramma]|nr:hypothetical protein DFH06DRAFT_195385 [Mycena polygramma]
MLCTLFLIHLHSLLTGTDNEHPNSYIILALAECTVSAASPCGSWRGSLPLLAPFPLPSVRIPATARRCKVKALKTHSAPLPVKMELLAADREYKSYWRRASSRSGASCPRSAHTDTRAHRSRLNKPRRLSLSASAFSLSHPCRTQFRVCSSVLITMRSTQPTHASLLSRILHQFRDLCRVHHFRLHF